MLFLTGCSDLTVGDELTHQDAAAEIAHPFGEEMIVRFSATLSKEDMDRISQQLRKTIARLEKEEQSLRAKLANSGFVDRAPAEVVETARERLVRVLSEKEAAEAQLRAAEAV
jgi:valyl-tRNA synthetase